MKLNQLLIATFVGAQFAAVAFADDATTNSTDAAQIEILKQEIQKLDQKVSDLESKLQAAQPSAAASDNAQIQNLDQKVRILERERENDQDAAATAQPKLALGANGFAFSSADSNFVATLHGLIQADSRTFINDGGGMLGKNSFLLRRARPIFSGTVFHDFDFNFTPDFGGTAVLIYDAYLNYH
jgi:phosphate-selective porin OprO/OprP